MVNWNKYAAYEWNLFWKIVFHNTKGAELLHWVLVSNVLEKSSASETTDGSKNFRTAFCTDGDIIVLIEIWGTDSFVAHDHLINELRNKNGNLKLISILLRRLCPLSSLLVKTRLHAIVLEICFHPIRQIILLKNLAYLKHLNLKNKQSFITMSSKKNVR